jgi:hypothetical protein
VRVFEATAGRELVANGYPLSEEAPPSLGPWSRALLEIESRVRHHRSRIRNFGSALWLAEILTRRLGTPALRARVRLALNEAENARLK